MDLRARAFVSMVVPIGLFALMMLASGADTGIVLAVGGVSAVFSFVLSGFLSRSIREPIEQMTKTADALQNGDFERRIRSSRTDEIGALAAAIDLIAEHLEERFVSRTRYKQQLRTILESMVEGVFVTGPDGRIVLTNAALMRLTGSDVEGQTAVDAIQSEVLQNAVRRASTESAVEVDFDIQVGGKRRSIAAQVAPLKSRDGVVAVLHDVTQLKRADSVRRDFVANASHELRTPLTAIRGFAETLADGALKDEKLAERFLNNILKNAVRLHNLVDDLLELSRAELPDSAFVLEAVDVVEVAINVLEGLENKADEKRLSLRLLDRESSVVALAHERALDQVLLNLVDNAIKYTPEGGEITVRAREYGERVVLEVADTGPGIPQKFHERIFERFYRIDKGRSRRQGGTGLGLSIVRHLAKRMKAEVSVDSEEGEGTTFRLSLAVPPSEPAQQGRLITTRTPPQPP